jgi:hypothetical protein
MVLILFIEVYVERSLCGDFELLNQVPPGSKGMFYNNDKPSTHRLLRENPP